MLDSDKLNNFKHQANIVFRSRFLANLSKVERYEFLQFCHHRTYDKGEHVYYQDDPGTGMYFIKDGSVQLITDDVNSDATYTHTLEAPDSFGALSIGYEFRRFATAKCVTDCTLMGFFKPDFETLKKRHPQIAVKFMETVAMLSMRQLSIAIERLNQTSGDHQKTPLQFDAYYDNQDDNNTMF